MMTHHTRLMRAHVRYAVITGLAFGAALGVCTHAATAGDLLAAAALIYLGAVSAVFSFVAYDEARNIGPDFESFTRRFAAHQQEPHA